ncbi:hypothetical protein SLS58_003933 [Diplodia intermedia]|uniref:G-protein coupled receptors family 2 profile 2 domain-containing protein n=1 Tax=Diplodia intermedia TaxID=856260 RepID=A0ABR3TVR4_9PEZI
MNPNQERALESVTRTTSAISLAACLFVLLTFTFFTAFRKPINRLIVYASIGNILTNTATVVSVAAIPSHGASWSLCRFQGFFIQMVVIAVIIFIYCYTGRVIFKQRKALRAFSRSNEHSLPQIRNPFNTPNAVTAVTEVIVTSESIRSEDDLRTVDVEADARSSYSSTRTLSGTTVGHRNNSEPSDNHPFQRYEPDNAVWPYSNAVSGGNGDPKNLFSTSVSAGAPVPAELLIDFDGPRPTSSSNGNRKTGSGGRHANDAAMGYAKVAFLMFLALFFVWIPSTANRVYALANPDKVNFPLNITAAIVLPTQGFWNFLIYVCTSWSQCKDAWTDVRGLLSGLISKKKRLGPDLEMGDGAPRPRARPWSSASELYSERRRGFHGSHAASERADADERDDAITPSGKVN